MVNFKYLKRHNQAKIMKKLVILFWLLNHVNMAIWCKHVHRLELQKFFSFCVAIYQLPWLSEIKDEIPVFLIFDMHVQNKKSRILSLYPA